ncbi:hypothetical protein GCG21_08670 [Pseudactinotalea sp. HY160]|uniref:hypothetical protein n=1 Tax=Pseudactinotalea sp. HY160 TaxID=2654490 RepID=UPI00128B7CA0|nr:hypothetical protein [Pseudactinotalea sp. HY160]MPV50077.1 hypothetical protein [Pseudactinotalea sp. HY160]
MSQSQAWDAYSGDEQPITNAIPVPPRAEQARPTESIPVWARLHWGRDGVEVIETEAGAWTKTHVLVFIDDRRCRLRGVWIPAGDVRRR